MAKKGTYPSTPDERREFSSQLADLIKRFGADQINIPQARPILQAILTDKLANNQFANPFFLYSQLLPSLEDQLMLIYRYNEELWGHPLSDNTFADVKTTSDHIQTVTDFLHFVVIFGNHKELFEAGVTVIEENVPNFCQGGTLKEGYDIQPLADNTIRYEAGIHVVHTNLVAHWDPVDDRSVDDIRERASIAGENLGYLEPLQSYGLAPKLLQQMDGKNFPYTELAGYKVKPPGDSEWRKAPDLSWDNDSRKAHVDSYRTEDSVRDCSAPVVWE